MLHSLGHQRVAVLDGGIQAWVESGGALETEEPPSWPPATLSVAGEPRTMPRDSLAGRLGGLRLLDARAAERYRGEIEPVDAAAGHIPTAVNVPHSKNLDPDGRFLSTERLRELYADAGITDAAEAVVYCGSGVTACHDILAMEVAGLGMATLYPGSWSDWSASGGPVATGSEPGQV
jgi:thiosulfate/3-mercaptopyruvate sulfurtransferase